MRALVIYQHRRIDTVTITVLVNHHTLGIVVVDHSISALVVGNHYKPAIGVVTNYISAILVVDHCISAVVVVNHYTSATEWHPLVISRFTTHLSTVIFTINGSYTPAN